MMTTKDKLITYTLTPLSWLYGAVVWVRNKLFDINLLKSESFSVPVIGVGNITVGGTGKTPHVEYLVENLSASYKIAVLSRGYRRRTKGFVLANSKSTPEQIGDEPMQIYEKYGMLAKVAVCENRKKGIRELLRLFPDLQLIILDDSFQHRWVLPKVSVMLMNYSRPIYKDHLLPLGRLREQSTAMNRADVVVVTKCPVGMQPIDFRIIMKDLNLMPYQSLFFSRYEYGSPKPVFAEDNPYSVSLSSLSERDSAMLLTGIAFPRDFVLHFKSYPFKKKVAHFADHHDFSREDLQDIFKKFKEMKGERKVILTTEKDAVRLVSNPYFPLELKPFVFYLPVSVRMSRGLHDDDFIEKIKEKIERHGPTDVISDVKDTE